MAHVQQWHMCICDIVVVAAACVARLQVASKPTVVRNEGLTDVCVMGG
jgi:hypothetical protein